MYFLLLKFCHIRARLTQVTHPRHVFRNYRSKNEMQRLSDSLSEIDVVNFNEDLYLAESVNISNLWWSKMSHIFDELPEITDQKSPIQDLFPRKVRKFNSTTFFDPSSLAHWTDLVYFRIRSSNHRRVYWKSAFELP